MSKVLEVRFDPANPESVVQGLNRLIQVLNNELDLGDPLDPTSDASTTLAGAAGASGHNGRPGNLRGSWAEMEFEALDTEVVATHNLGAEVTNSEVNVRWLLCGMRHSGAGTVTGVEPISIRHEDGDTLTTNSIGLRAYAAGSPTVDASNPIRVSLWFFRVTRWPD